MRRAGPTKDPLEEAVKQAVKDSGAEELFHVSFLIYPF